MVKIDETRHQHRNRGLTRQTKGSTEFSRVSHSIDLQESEALSARNRTPEIFEKRGPFHWGLLKRKLTLRNDAFGGTTVQNPISQKKATFHSLGGAALLFGSTFERVSENVNSNSLNFLLRKCIFLNAFQKCIFLKKQTLNPKSKT